MTDNTQKENYFSCPIWIEQKPEFLNLAIAGSERHIKEARKNNKDFGLAHHSKNLTNDPDFNEFSKYIIQKSFLFLYDHGYCLKDYSLIVTVIWVQEFSKEGGGNHNSHIHSNNHVSGFYFLKCSDKTSYPIFHDPRPGKLMLQLPEKNIHQITEASEKICIVPKPGTFIFFNSYLNHEFAVDYGIEPFRFIHFNIQAVSKQLIK